MRASHFLFIALSVPGLATARPMQEWWNNTNPCPPNATLTGTPGKDVRCIKSDGTQHGRQTVWFDNGQIAQELNFQEGKRHGRNITWNEDGKKATEVHYAAGELHGAMIVCGEPTRIHRDERKGDRIIGWYEDGQKAEEIIFKDGKPQHTSFCRRLSLTHYQHGKEQGPATLWHENGLRAMVVEFAGGKTQGIARGWHPNGRPAVEGQFVDGEKHGLWTHWYEFGGGAKLEKWSDGVLVSTSYQKAEIPSSDVAVAQ